jgi:hypothetical protein
MRVDGERVPGRFGQATTRAVLPVPVFDHAIHFRGGPPDMGAWRQCTIDSYDGTVANYVPFRAPGRPDRVRAGVRIDNGGTGANINLDGNLIVPSPDISLTIAGGAWSGALVVDETTYTPTYFRAPEALENTTPAYAPTSGLIPPGRYGSLPYGTANLQMQEGDYYFVSFDGQVRNNLTLLGPGPTNIYIERGFYPPKFTKNSRSDQEGRWNRSGPGIQGDRLAAECHRHQRRCDRGGIGNRRRQAQLRVEDHGFQNDLMLSLSLARYRRGVSIIETLVCSAIMALLFGSTLMALVASKERAARSSDQIEMEEEAIKAMSLLSEELAESNFGCIYAPSEQLLVFPLPRSLAGAYTVEPSGELRWSTLVSFRGVTRDGRSHLIRQIADVTDAVGAPIDPEFLTPLPDAAFFAAQSTPERAMARGFRRLGVTPADGSVGPELEVELVSGRRTIGLELRSSVWPRN